MGPLIFALILFKGKYAKVQRHYRMSSGPTNSFDFVTLVLARRSETAVGLLNLFMRGLQVGLVECIKTVLGLLFFPIRVVYGALRKL